MDTLKHKEELLKSLEKALVQYKKLIEQEIDLVELDPEKAKAAAQGKSEATKGFRETLNIMDELKLEIEQEKIARNGGAKKSTFSGLENRVK